MSNLEVHSLIIQKEQLEADLLAAMDDRQRAREESRRHRKLAEDLLQAFTTFMSGNQQFFDKEEG